MRAREIIYPSNILSLGRLLLAAPIAYLIWLDSPNSNRWLLVLLFAAIASDVLDGFLSRALNQRSELGRVLDPLADKVIMIVVLACLVLFRSFPARLFVLLLCRDVLILLFGWIVSRRQGRIVEVSLWGKINTVVVAATGLAFLLGARGWPMEALLVASYVTILVSGIAYYRFAEPHLLQRAGARWALRIGVAAFASGSVWLAPKLIG